MRKGIVLKLFILTTALCMLILATIFIGQTIFFKQYYANRKVKDIQTNMAAYEKSYLSSSRVEAIQKLEQDFYRENNTWITTLDRYGNLRNADDFYLEVKLEPLEQKEIKQATMRIPLYNLVSFDEVEEIAERTQMTGMPIFLSGIEKDSTFIPSILSMENGNTQWSNKTLDKKMSDIVLQMKKDHKTAEEVPFSSFTGVITKLQIPDKTERFNPIYKNNLFMESIKEFQSDLLLDESKNIQDSLQTIDYEKNDIKYKLLIKPIKEKDGTLTYIFALGSLQPVDEAVQMVKDYYVYIIAFVLVLIFLASFYYPKLRK